jgi:hypothetical protein
MTHDDADSRDPARPSGAARRRLVLASGAAVALLASAVVAFPSYGGSASSSATGGDFKRAYDVASRTAAAMSKGQNTVYFPDGTHIHLNGGKVTKDGHLKLDPKAKNAVSRAAETVDSDTADPTTPAQARRAESAVAAQRAVPDPTLSKSYIRRGHGAVPSDRYEMAGGCYAIQSTKNSKWLRMAGTSPTFDATSMSSGLPVFFKATDLGSYLLHALDHQDLAKTLLGVGFVGTPSEDADWTVKEVTPSVFTFTLPNKQSLTTSSTGKATLGATPARFKLHLTDNCTAFPEITTNVSGNPFSGISSFQEVRGLIDAHMHGMAFEFLGGDAHCGKPWSKFGVEFALKDCPDHYYTDGKGAILEAFLSGKPSHDPVGWPTFKDWPAPDSLTHEGTYYKWLERAWRGGERIMVNLLVENDQLCRIYPIKHNSCDDMDSIRLQAKDMRLLERYVDAQSGGPGWGWYRIVESPAQARAVINKGKLAVIMGIETSVPFGCTMKLNIPQCDQASINRQLDEVQKLGVRQMELVNKFDNALSGVAGDEGTTGNLVNGANFLETGSFWQMEHCAVQDPEIHDKDQTTTPTTPGTPAQDAIFGAIFALDGPTMPVPVYPSPHHCNVKGLTSLGDYTIRGLAKRHMIFDPDHMSVKARKSSLDLIDTLKYPGVVSSHSWSTPDAYPRIYKEGGFITPYAGDSTGFVAKWKRHLTWADPRYYFGFGFGADINGLGAQGDPRPGAATHNPVTYPFKGLGGVTINKQVSGQRVYDINKDGVAQYGLYPDWVEDLRHLAGNAIVKDMSRGPEAYLQMWERADGVKPNACVNEDQRKKVSFFTALAKGSTTWQVLTKAGQPDQRRGTTYTYCAGTTASPATVRVSFTSGGRLTKVARVS